MQSLPPMLPAPEKFREEVRAFLREKMPTEVRRAPRTSILLDIALQQRWHRILADQGWVAPGWPVKYGGADWPTEYLEILDEEFRLAEAPPVSPFLRMIGPVLIAYGTDAQRADHLPPLLAGERLWCQGYSEPGSGSDLASLKTSAVRDGDDYVVNGQKIWTTNAHHADWMFCLVRTGGGTRKQLGISFLLIDLKTPGIVIRPIYSLDGLHHLNEVFFTDVRVPTRNLVGQEGDGWTIAKFLLEHERKGVGSLRTVRGQLQRLKRLVQGSDTFGLMSGAELNILRQGVAQAEIEIFALDTLHRRYAELAAQGECPLASASILKVQTTRLQQRIGELATDALGPWVSPDQSHLLEPFRGDQVLGPEEGPEALLFYLFGRAFTILGGTTEVQKDIIFRLLPPSNHLI